MPTPSTTRRWLSGLLLSVCALQALAQGYPARPVTMTVPWPAGGPSDFVARKLQADMATALGQPLVIDNVGGAGGAIGVQKMLNTPADGYNITLGSPLELVVAPLVLLARKDLPASTVDELIALTSRPGAQPLSFANGGNGSLFHLVAEKMGQQTGAKFLHVPYKGSTPMMTDLMGGQVDLAFTIFAGPIPSMIADGKVKAIGLASRAPLARFPQIPALAAHPRLQGFEFDSWAAVVVPRNTPEAVAQRLNQAVYAALRNPETRAAFEATGNQIVSPASVAELDQMYREQTARYQAIARAINFMPQ